MNACEKDIFAMYQRCRIGVCAKCAMCRKENPSLSKPISIWHVGSRYAVSEYRVLFVGKAARGSIEHDAGSINGVSDATALARELYYTSGWAFWNYTRTIANGSYGADNAWEQIAITNMVKCNASETVDTTSGSVKRHCAEYLRREIELLSPKNIVFYTNAWYDDAVAGLFDRIEQEDHRDMPCGQKQMHIWSFTGVMNGHSMRVIRTGHPERMNKADFTGCVIDFIQGRM